MAVVALKDVTKVFRGKRETVVAVDHVTLEIADGELVVLVGPSGCGKTTTLRLIAGLDRLSGGSIEIAGRLVNDVAPKDRDVALVFQNYALYPHLAVYDNLAFGLKMHRTPKSEIRSRVGAIAKLLKIEDLLTRRPHELSGGQQQRVALGRAIVRRPNVYLFDEPLANLDAQLRVQTRRELKRMHRELGMTALYVTHDQYEAMALGDRIAVMHQGRVQQIGVPTDVYNRPNNRFVAGFIGVPPMNFLDGRLVNGDGTTSFDFGVGRTALPAPLSRRLARRAGETMTLGVRPERVRLATATDDPAGVRVTVTMVEPAGDRVDVYASLSDGREFVASVPASASLSEGQVAFAVFDPEGVALFERGEAGVNVLAQEEV